MSYETQLILNIAGILYTEHYKNKYIGSDKEPLAWNTFSKHPGNKEEAKEWVTKAAAKVNSWEMPVDLDITSANYVQNAIRTESMDLDAIASRLCDPDTIRLLHSAMGLSTEAGEFLDMLKKHIFYGKELDLTNAKEEIGDSMWYAAIGIDVLRTTLNDVMQGNINKLRKRYPEKFNKEDALCRDLDGERKILEDL